MLSRYSIVVSQTTNSEKKADLSYDISEEPKASNNVERQMWTGNFSLQFKT